VGIVDRCWCEVSCGIGGDILWDASDCAPGVVELDIEDDATGKVSLAHDAKPVSGIK